MSRVLAGLVALFLVPVFAFAQVPPPPLAGAAISVAQGITGSVIGGLTAPPQGPARDQAAPKTGTSRIRGRVVGADSGLGLRRAAVGISSPDIRETRGTVTDADGRYEFIDLPAGRYSVIVNKTGYVQMSYGQRRPNDAPKQIDVGEKQVVDKIDFVLPRGGVITGRVLDEFGEPLANANVQPMQNRFMNGQRRPMPMGQGATTPDTGEFRLWGLSPGDYFVSVTPRQNGMNMGDNSDDRSGYAATYYPGTPNLALAQPITIAAGQTASGVDITLTPTRTAKVSGTAVDSKGLPIENGFVNAMQRANSMMFSNIGGQIRAGTFTISGLPPGDYMLRANAMQSRPGNEPPEILTANVSVNGTDVTGVLLAPVLPVVVTGRVVFDPPTAPPDPTSVRVMANPKNPEMMMGMMMNVGPQIVKDDFTFELKTSPGQMVIRANVNGPGANPAPQAPGAWMLKSVRYDANDVTDSGLELTSGRDVSDVEIVMTNRPQIVTGQVTNARAEIVKEGTVLLFSQDREQWASGFGRHMGMSRPDKDGKYTLRTLPAGDYFAVAIEQVDNQRFPGDPDYFDLLSRSAVRFSLVEGETRIVDLTLTVQQ